MVSNNFWWCRGFTKICKYLEIIRTKIEENTGGAAQYDKDYMKIKVESNDNLPTDKTVNIRLAAIIIRSVFAQNGNFILNYF